MGRPVPAHDEHHGPPNHTTPDHEHLYHGGQTVETVRAARRPHYHPDAWLERVLEQTQSIVVARGAGHDPGASPVHEGRGRLADVRPICSHLSSFGSAWAMETTSARVINLGPRKRPAHHD